MRFFTGDFASWTVHFVNICVKNQQMQELFTQSSDVVYGDRHAPRNILSTAPQLSISQKALGTLPE
jgi:hypothetical protein